MLLVKYVGNGKSMEIPSLMLGNLGNNENTKRFFYASYVFK